MIGRGRRFELFAWNASPAMLTLLLALLCFVPMPLSGLADFMPLLAMTSMYFWGSYEARDMPFGFVFLLGFLSDAMSGHPLGVSSLLNIFFLTSVHAQRKYIHKEGFVIKWGYFAMLLGIYQLALWLSLSVLSGHRLPLGAGFFQWLLTVCVYPLFHKIYERLAKLMHHRRWQIIHGL